MHCLNLRLASILLLTISLIIWPKPVPAEEPTPPELRNVGIDPVLGRMIGLDETFTNEAGQSVRLGQYFNQDKPVVLILAYYECPMLCTLVLNNFAETLQKMDWTPGQQFEVVTVSFDPRETAQLAADKKQNYLAAYGRPGAAAGWHFLVGKEPAIKALTGQLGFKYYYDEKQKQFAHATGIFILTPRGKLSQCLYGIDFTPKDLRLALVEASEGKVGSALDKLFLFCYHYDPASRSYTLMATRVMQLGGTLTVLILGSVIGALFWRERRQAKALASAAGGGEKQDAPPATTLTPKT